MNYAYTKNNAWAVILTTQHGQAKQNKSTIICPIYADIF